LSYSAVVDALGVAIAVRHPVLVWGTPGAGKSSAVKAVASRATLECQVVNVAVREPADFLGVPKDRGDTTVYSPPAWARAIVEAGGGIVFFDDIDSATPAVQAALLQVVLERRSGDLYLGDDVAMVGAANDLEHSAGGWDLAPSLANRFCHLDWEIDPMVVADGIAEGFESPPAPKLDSWLEAEAACRQLVGRFLRRRPELVSQPPGPEVRSVKGWPSPRAWEAAARLWGAAVAAEVGEETVYLLVSGAVGPGGAEELLSWVENDDLADPEVLLAAPDSFPIIGRADRVYAQLGALTAALASNNTPERWAAAWVVVGRVVERFPDVAATAARLLARSRPEGAAPPPQLAQLADILDAAGLRQPGDGIGAHRS